MLYLNPVFGHAIVIGFVRIRLFGDWTNDRLFPYFGESAGHKRIGKDIINWKSERNSTVFDKEIRDVVRSLIEFWAERHEEFVNNFCIYWNEREAGIDRWFQVGDRYRSAVKSGVEEG